jgi:hypothetical protein
VVVRWTVEDAHRETVLMVDPKSHAMAESGLSKRLSARQDLDRPRFCQPRIPGVLRASCILVRKIVTGIVRLAATSGSADDALIADQLQSWIISCCVSCPLTSTAGRMQSMQQYLHSCRMGLDYLQCNPTEWVRRRQQGRQ